MCVNGASYYITTLNKLMKYAVILFFVLIISLFSFTQIDIQTVKVDIEASVVEWKASKVLGKHNGTLELKSGNLEFADGELSGGVFLLDMTSIQCTDLEGEYKDKLEGHLKSADFFGVKEFPTANFLIKNVYSRGTPGDYKIVGDVTIKGVTKEIKFNTLIADDIAKATITLDRTDYDVRYGSGTFFSNLGDKSIHDNFDLDVKIIYGEVKEN